MEDVEEEEEAIIGSDTIIDCGGVRDIIPTEVPSGLESKLSTGGLMTSMLIAPNDENRPLFASKDIAKFYKDHSPGTNLELYRSRCGVYSLLTKRKVFSSAKKRKTLSVWKRVVFSLLETTFLESGFSKFTKHGQVVSRKVVKTTNQKNSWSYGATTKDISPEMVVTQLQVSVSYEQSLKKTRLRILLRLEFDPFDFSTFLIEAHWHKLKDIR
ncbi:hypothetical protein SADUNF_Sadunf18G0110500 [Salix dunnii]|uniref:Uncharacterized protein n=1 Tax=Salix dunnii TaxID=1413687 RepID=A0A835ME09_9ROSI|nr:hypothetical protein SADUNF_Sadunf18G0110500 [Salix dunnii]